MSYLDRAFCRSPNCKNDCGRKLTPELAAANKENLWISYAYFCDIPLSQNQDIPSCNESIVSIAYTPMNAIVGKNIYNNTEIITTNNKI